VTKTQFGYKPISKSFFVKPTSGVSPSTQDALFQTTSNQDYYKEEDEDFDENDRHYMRVKHAYEMRDTNHSDVYSESTKNGDDE